MRLSKQQQEAINRQFAEQGYFHAKAVFTPQETALLETEFDHIVQRLIDSGEDINARWTGKEMNELGRDTDQVLHTHNVHRYSRHWLDATLNEKLLDLASSILGEDIVLHHSKLFQKPAEEGAPFPMHQDWPYFPSRLDQMIAGIIHVSEATDEMGCLRVWPGSHKLGRIADSHGQSGSQKLADYPIEEAVAIEANPGDVIFFHYFTLHGSMPNRSAKTRKTVLLQLYSGQDEVGEGLFGHHVNEQLVLRGHNHAISRQAAGTSG